MASLEVIFAITAGVVGILTLVVLFSTGSVVAVLALWLVVLLILLVLWYYGFIEVDKLTSMFTPKTTKCDTVSHFRFVFWMKAFPR